MAGVVDGGDRTVPLTFKATAELVQAVDQKQVAIRVGGLGMQFVICPSPFQTETQSLANCCCSFSAV